MLRFWSSRGDLLFFFGAQDDMGCFLEHKMTLAVCFFEAQEEICCFFLELKMSWVVFWSTRWYLLFVFWSSRGDLLCFLIFLLFLKLKMTRVVFWSSRWYWLSVFWSSRGDLLFSFGAQDDMGCFLEQKIHINPERAWWVKAFSKQTCTKHALKMQSTTKQQHHNQKRQFLTGALKKSSRNLSSCLS